MVANGNAAFACFERARHTTHRLVIRSIKGQSGNHCKPKMTDKSAQTILMQHFFIQMVVTFAVCKTHTTQQGDCSHTPEQISSASTAPTCRRPAAIRRPLQSHHKHARLWMGLPSTLLHEGPNVSQQEGGISANTQGPPQTDTSALRDATPAGSEWKQTAEVQWKQQTSLSCTDISYSSSPSSSSSCGRGCARAHNKTHKLK